MFPMHTNFDTRTIEGHRILFADTSYKSIDPMTGELSEDETIINIPLGEVVDKEYPMPLRIKASTEVDDMKQSLRVEFLDIEFIKVYNDNYM